MLSRLHFAQLWLGWSPSSIKFITTSSSSSSYERDIISLKEKGMSALSPCWDSAKCPLGTARLGRQDNYLCCSVCRLHIWWELPEEAEWGLKTVWGDSQLPQLHTEDGWQWQSCEEIHLEFQQPREVQHQCESPVSANLARSSLLQ